MASVRVKSQIPDEILNDPVFQQALRNLPPNYNFELAKTVWRIRILSAKKVALQLPEGLLLYACLLADVMSDMTSCDVCILADVTYGACCVDHFTAKALGCELLVHYGHSCLVPVQETPGIQMLYVFVDIKFDTAHLIDTVVANFEPSCKMALFSTIQFVSTLQVVFNELKRLNFNQVTVPQAKPLSKGEILGCTAPTLTENTPDVLLYVGDGRFHLEAAMIANKSVKAFRYDPYAKEITRERYDHAKMLAVRQDSLAKARHASTFGLILGSLGRQGNPKIYSWLQQKFGAAGKKCIQIVLSEIFPSKLDMFDSNEFEVDCWIQVACPRLSIDWGIHFKKPLLTPYEAAVLLQQTEWQVEYPMDYYSSNSSGPWTNKHPSNVPAVGSRKRLTIDSENQ